MTETLAGDFFRLLKSSKGGQLSAFGLRVDPRPVRPHFTRNIYYHDQMIAQMSDRENRVQLRLPQVQDLIKVQLITPGTPTSQSLQFAFNTTQIRGETAPVYEFILTGDIPHKTTYAAALLFNVLLDGFFAGLFMVTNDLLTKNARMITKNTYRARSHDGRIMVEYTRVSKDEVIFDKIRLRLPIRLRDPMGYYSLGGDNVWPRNMFEPIFLLWRVLLSSRVLDTGAQVVEEDNNLFLEIDRKTEPRNRRQLRVDNKPMDIAFRAAKDPRQREIEDLMRLPAVGRELDRLQALKLHLKKLQVFVKAADETEKKIQAVLTQRGTQITLDDLLRRQERFVNSSIE